MGAIRYIPGSLFIAQLLGNSSFLYCLYQQLLYLCKPNSGEVSEWSKEHAWKVCIPQKGIEGSNPSLSADFNIKSN
jgi:hypothetical protein